MSVPGVVLGDRLGPFPGRIPRELVRQYAAATRDPNGRAAAGEAVPPVAVVTQIWEAQQAGFTAVVPDEVRASMTGGVHGEHDVVLHRPIVPGEDLRTWVQPWGARRGGKHALLTLRYATYDTADALVAEQWWTTVLLNATGEPVGEAAPDHTFPEAARAHHVGDYRIDADGDMPRRYAEVSSDWSPHHFDSAAARQSGADRPFLHGLCTMALCAQGAVSILAGGDPERVRRVAVRFASPTFIGDELEVHLYRASDRVYAFEADAGGAAVIRNGLFELRVS
ncbi:MAG TPA: MaoC/PaaZ C-terminal domain-containing protein [Acidimicrobiales bacterium]|nr:MaoC/PaaZ C-terminal domain-containing protein [Acidimicrobiales bacterium]